MHIYTYIYIYKHTFINICKLNIAIHIYHLFILGSCLTHVPRSRGGKTLKTGGRNKSFAVCFVITVISYSDKQE